MNLKPLFASATRSIFSWRLILRELVTVTIAWGTYLTAPALLAGPPPTLPSGAEHQLLNLMFWGSVAMTVVSLSIASVKSALPAALGCIAPLPLHLLGYFTAAAWAPLVALAGVFLYVIGFAFHAGNLGVTNRA